MYRYFIRRLLFLINPESVHHLIVFFIKGLFKIPGISYIFRKTYSVEDKKLEKNVFGLNFKNPVGLAAGFDKNATFFNEFSNFGFGFIEIGSVTPLPQQGNPKPRIFRLPIDQALINRMGFNNYGADAALIRLKNRKGNLIIGGNIGKNTQTPNDIAVNDYVYSFNKLYQVVDYFVVNVSCPNISDLHKLADHDSLLELLQTLADQRETKSVKKPILLKISPDLNFAQIEDTLHILKQTGMDGIVAVNTTISRDHLNTSKSELEKIGKGGLSGQPLNDRSNEIIKFIHEKTEGKLPIIGVGGIMNPKDAIDKLNAGASLVQIYSGFIYYGPNIVSEINNLIRNQ